MLSTAKSANVGLQLVVLVFAPPQTLLCSLHRKFPL